jgi:hypothetical protein
VPFDTVVGKYRFTPALARNADKGLVVGRNVELARLFCIVFGIRVDVDDELDRVSVEKLR